MKNIIETIYDHCPESHVQMEDGSIFLAEDAKILAGDVVRMLREFGNEVAKEQINLCSAWAAATMNADRRASDPLNVKRFELFTDCIRVKI